MDDCTWEPKENLSCFELMEEYERSLNKKDVKPVIAGRRSKYEDEFDALSSVSTARDAPLVDPYLENPMSEAQEIVEVGKRGDQLAFRVKWTGGSGSEWISASVANQRIPHIVLRYYEQLALGKIEL